MAEDSDSETRHVARLHPNQHYDESVDINDSEEVISQYSPTPRVFNRANYMKTKEGDLDEDDDDQSIDSTTPGPKKLVVPTHATNMSLRERTSDNEDEDEDDDDGDGDIDDENYGSNIVEGGYDPKEFENLPVSSEIKELFNYVGRYVPQTLDLEFRLEPFIPDYIPAVGDIDAFLKIPRVDGKPDTLGLTVLDEPCMKQSDPVVLDLMLRSLSKESNVPAKISVKSIDIGQDSNKHIDSWIKSIDKLHRNKPLPSVNYSKKMPEIDELMQEWPPALEESMADMLPPSDLTCDLAQMADLACALLDIPVNGNRIQSLHLLFTLYSEFQNSQHFQNKQ